METETGIPDYGHYVELLVSADRAEQSAARVALAAGGRAARVALRSGLAHRQGKARARSAATIAGIGDEADVAPLGALLSDPLPGVRRAALHALAGLKRRGAAWRDDTVALVTGRALEDSNMRVRRVAAQALGVPPRDPTAVAAMQTLLAGETDGKLLYNARWAFPAPERQRIARLPQARKAERHASREADLARWSRLEALASRDLVECLGSMDDLTARGAAHVLFQRGRGAMEALLAGFAHPDWRVRRECVGSMDHLGDSRCVPPLSLALQDAAEGVRRSALHSISCQACKEAPLEGDIVGPVVERALADRSLHVRRVATLALGGMPHDPRSVTALQTIIQEAKDAVCVARAREALRQLAAQEVNSAG